MSIPVTIDIDALSFKLLSGIIKCLWRQDENDNIAIFKAFIPYFLSIYPKMSPVCFGATLPEEEKFTGEDGRQYFDKYWI